MSTTPKSCAHVCTPPLTSAATVELLPLERGGWLVDLDDILLKGPNGRTLVFAQRHPSLRRTACLGRWEVNEYRIDSLGREWSRDFFAVADDFGWLVEVPAR